MILVLDNYDSFVHNLARHIRLAGRECVVIRNDAVSLAQIRKSDYEAIVISPGPCSPAEAGICVEAVQALGPHVPILGVCLGHQCIGAAYGAKVVQGPPVHGRASDIFHDGTGVFSGLPTPFKAGRYHSLVVEDIDATGLRAQALTVDGIIMGLQHQAHPVYGVQFHPESILTEHGLMMIRNFIACAATWHSAREHAA